MENLKLSRKSTNKQTKYHISLLIRFSLYFVVICSGFFFQFSEENTADFIEYPPPPPPPKKKQANSESKPFKANKTSKDLEILETNIGCLFTEVYSVFASNIAEKCTVVLLCGI